MGRTYSVTISDEKKRKRKKINNGKKSTGKALLLVFLILILVGFGGYYFVSSALNCEGENCNPIIGGFKTTIDPKLDQDKGLTNILLVGIDTRETNAGLMNTDTLMILTIDYENQTSVMTSIPRDLWVTYTLPNGNATSSKVNSAYANGEWQEEGAGIETLKGVVETIIGEPIHYYVKITLKGFVEAIDSIGGVDIDIPEDYIDAYPASELPEDLQATCDPYYHDGKYCKYYFGQGVEHMDGQRALIYSRCRLFTSDFDRAARQQRVINAVKDKALSSETLLNPEKILDLYKVVKDSVETDFNMSITNINEIRAAINLKDKVDPDNIGKVVLDPYLGHVIGEYIYKPDNTLNGYIIIARDTTYEPIQELLGYVRKYPLIYNEETSISIYNATGLYTLEKDWLAELEAENPLFLVKQVNRVIPNPDNQYQGIMIYKFTEEEKPASEEYLKDFFGVSEIITEFEDGTVNYSGEDYVIVIGTEDATTE
jgi:LCP family protein required for cell wall assembly